ncbi:MAG: YjhX family toxin [Amphiplicatus sp.]
MIAAAHAIDSASDISMNISKAEQRALHALARGGAIHVEKDARGKIIAVNCATVEGWTLADCTLAVFRKLKRRRLVASRGGGPYRITREGRLAVRPQPDNRA